MASGGSTAGHGRQEQAARPALVWSAGARNQRLKKHDGCWMDIVRSLQLESFILTKLTKPLVRQLFFECMQISLVGPQVSFRNGEPQMSGGGIIIFRVIRRHFLAAVVDPAVSLSTYSPRPMEAVP